MLTFTSPVIAPPTADPAVRRADIQGLRAAAVLMVVLFHAGAALPGGFVGVDVFFVVSGFVISGLLMRELAASGRIRLRHFYLRRARRLLPALALVSVATLGGAALLLSPLGGAQGATGDAAAAATAFVANGYFALSSGYFNPVAEANPFLHTWSLSVEEQFYLGFPVLLLLAWYLHRRYSRRWLPALLILAFGASLGAGISFTFGWLPSWSKLVVLVTNPELAERVAFYSPVTRAWEFLLGSLIAVVGRRWMPGAMISRVFGVCGAVLLCVAAIGLGSQDRFPGALALLPAGAAACVLLAGSSPGANAVTRLFSTRPLVALGDLSYSWYLWHWPAIVFAKAWFPAVPGIGLLAALVSLVPAALSNRWVERPIHQGRRLVSRRATAALIVASLAIPIGGGIGLAAAAERGWGRNDIAAIQAAVRPAHVDMLTRCANLTPLGSPLRPPCIWSVARPRGTILLIGDSNAGQLTEPMIGAAHALGMDLQVASPGGCPFVRLEHYFTEPCRLFVEQSVASIAARNPAYAAIVISNATIGYLNGSLARDLLLNAPAGVAGGDRERAIAGWSRSMRETVRVVSSHSPVVVIGAIPQYASFPACLAPSVLLGPAAGCGEIGPDDVRRQRDDIISAERRALSPLVGAYVDTGARLCSPTTGCSTRLDGLLAYRDGAHLSVAGSYLFQEDLRSALAPLLAHHPQENR